MDIIKYILTASLFLVSLGGCQKVAAQLPVQSLLGENGIQTRKQKDSINRFVQPSSYFLTPRERFQRVNDLYLREIGQDWLEKTMSSSTQLVADTTKDAGLLSAAYGLLQGGFHPPQEAYSHKEVSVSTWGFRQLGRTKVGGYFSYTTIWEDSLSANLTGQADGMTPYYYFSPKAGTFERQLYRMGLSLDYNIVKDQLFLGMGLDYLQKRSTGSVDPRPEDTWMKVEFKPSLIYKRGSTLLGLSLIKGYGRQDMDIAYKNTMYDKGNAYPERSYYLNMGYGSIVLKTPLVKDILQDEQGLALDFSTSWQRNTLRGGLTYLKTYRDSRYNPDTARLDDKLARWSVGSYNGWLQLKFSKGNHSSLWQFDWNHEKGHDSNVIFGGRNYFASDNNLGLAFLQYHGNSGRLLNWEWGAATSYHELERNDILAAHYLRGQALDFGVNGNLYVSTKKATVWTLKWKPAIVYPLRVEATVPSTQQNAFTENVFYPMISYLSTVRLSNSLKLGFVSAKLIGGTYSGFELGLDYLNRLSTLHFDGIQVPVDLTEVSSKIEGSRLHLNLAFKLYL